MLISFTGSWMQGLAQSWLVYRLSGSPWLLGVVAFAGQAPILLVAPIAGVMADRYSKLRIVMLTQTLAMAQALILATLTITHLITVEVIVALSAILGTITAFDVPTRQSFTVELVGKDDLMNAIALNSSMINGARIVGPALAGLLVAWTGEGVCFFLNAASYMVVLLGLLAIRLDARDRARAQGSALTHIKEAVGYITRVRPVRSLLLLVAIVSLGGLPYLILLPIFADAILEAGPEGLGLLTGAGGIGAMSGALTIAARRETAGLPRLVGLSVLAFGALLIAFSASRNLILSAVLVVPIGFTLMLQLPATNTLLQSMAPDHMRGRVMSFYSMCLIGVSPFGSLIAGWVATLIGAPATLVVGGLACLAAAVVFLLRLPRLRQQGFDQLLRPAADPEVTDASF
jgi:MFS family permease